MSRDQAEIMLTATLAAINAKIKGLRVVLTPEQEESFNQSLNASKQAFHKHMGELDEGVKAEIERLFK